MYKINFSGCRDKGSYINTQRKYGAFLIVLMIFILFTGCAKNQTEVDMAIPEPINQIVNQLTINNPDCNCHPYIDHYIWKNQNIYVVAINDSLNIGYVCDWIPLVYDSNGKNIPLKPGYTYVNLVHNARFIKNVWACK